MHSRGNVVGEAALSWSRLSPPTYSDPGCAWHANSGRILCHNHSSFPRLHSCVTVPEEEALSDNFSECESTGDRFLIENSGTSVAFPLFLLFAQLCYSVRHLTRRSASRLSRHSRTRISRLMCVNVGATATQTHIFVRFPVSTTQTMNQWRRHWIRSFLNLTVGVYLTMWRDLY